MDRRGVAAMEFAMVAPVMLLIIWGVFDISRALLAWEETVHAAQAVAQAAEKLSITTATKNGQPITSLTATQMQTAMTTIYAEMPWLNLGNNTGLFTGQYSVTLSSVAYLPLCTAEQAAKGVCGGSQQTPTVLWSAYLTEGGQQLLTPPPPPNNKALYRICGALQPVPQFPDNASQRLYMIDPDLVKGAAAPNLIMPPQVVADVQYTFTPSFPLLAGRQYTFFASATFPAPVGDDDQEIVFNATGSQGVANTVQDCPADNPQ